MGFSVMLCCKCVRAAVTEGQRLKMGVSSSVRDRELYDSFGFALLNFSFDDRGCF